MSTILFWTRITNKSINACGLMILLCEIISNLFFLPPVYACSHLPLKTGPIPEKYAILLLHWTVFVYISNIRNLPFNQVHTLKDILLRCKLNFIDVAGVLGTHCCLISIFCRQIWNTDAIAVKTAAAAVTWY